MSDKNFKVKNGIDAVGPITVSPSSNLINGLIFNTLAGGRAITFNRNGTNVGSIDDWGTYNGSGINIVQPWSTRSPGLESQSFFWVGSGARSAAGFAGTNSGTNPVIYIAQIGTATNDLTQWIKPDNTILAKVDYLGNITANDLTLAGNLTVNGTTTNLNSTNLIIEDKNIIIADVATPTDTTADGAGITIKGATDKTFNWVQSTGRFTSSEPIQSSAFVSTYVYASQVGSTVIGSATLNTNLDTGGLLINTAGAANKGLSIRGAASQTANLQEWQNSDGTVLTKIDSSGRITSTASDHYFGSNAAYRPNIHITNTTADSNGSYILFEKSKAGSAVVANDVLGVLNFTGFDTATYAGSAIIYGVAEGTFSPTSRPGKLVFATVPSGGTTMTDRMTIANSGTVTINGFGAAAQGLIVKGAASQTANLQEWQISNGSVDVAVIPSKGILHNLGNDTNGSQNLTQIAFGYNAPAGPLGYWKHYITTNHNSGASTGNSINFYTSDGVQSGAYPTNAVFGLSITNGGMVSPKANINVSSASTIGLTIKAAASQTANLQQWQNSAGGVLAYVSNDGTFQNTGDINSGSTIRLGSGASSAGGYPVFAIKNATVAPTSNPTDGGVIYVESGSLKYRGQGGAITTVAPSSLDDQEDIENSEVQLIQYGAEGSVLQNLPTRIHPAEQLLKESVLWLDPAHSSAGSQTIQNLGWGGTALNATAGENTSVSTDEPKYLSWEGENYIYATGETGNFMISSASTSLGMTTSSDLDMRVKVSLDVLSGRDQMLISSWWYRLHLTSAGYVGLSWNDNTSFNNIYSSSLLSSAATVGQEIWIRGTLKLNNGSGVSEVKFYTSKDGTTWTQLGTTYNGASTSILGAGGRLLSIEVGSLDGGVASVVSGKIYRAQVLQGVDGVVVFDCDTSLVSSGSATTFNALTGHIMTITRSTVGRKMVAVTHPLWLFGTNDYLKIADNNLLDFTTNQPFTIFLSSREFASTAGTTVLLSKGGYGVWQGYTITSGDSYTQLYFSGPQANSSYYYSPNLGKSTTSRNYFYGRSTTNTFSYVNNNLIGGAEEVAPQYDTSNNYDFYLGRQVSGQYSNMEVFGVAIWRRALTSAEIATVSRYYEGRAI